MARAADRVVPLFLHECRPSTGAAPTAHGGHPIPTRLSLRAQSIGAFLALMIRMQHQRPTPGTGYPLTLTSIGQLCRLYLVRVSTNIKQTSYSLSRLR